METQGVVKQDVKEKKTQTSKVKKCFSQMISNKMEFRPGYPGPIISSLKYLSRWVKVFA